MKTKLTKTEAIRDFLTDEQIMEVLILAENRRMEAARLMAEYMDTKWRLTTLEAVKLLCAIMREWEEKDNK